MKIRDIETYQHTDGTIFTRNGNEAIHMTTDVTWKYVKPDEYGGMYKFDYIFYRWSLSDVDNVLRSEIFDKTTFHVRYYDWSYNEQGGESVIGLEGIRELLSRGWDQELQHGTQITHFSFGTGISSYKLNRQTTYIRIMPGSSGPFIYVNNSNKLRPPRMYRYSDRTMSGIMNASLVMIEFNGTNVEATTLLEADDATFSTTVRTIDYWDTKEEVSKHVTSFDAIKQAIFDYLDTGYDRFKIDNFTMNEKTISFTSGSGLYLDDGWIRDFDYEGSEHDGWIGTIDVTST